MAGPIASLVLAGLAVIAIVLWPESQFNSLLFKFAIIAYITTLLDFNPLLELDGYYILMDWLEIPMLRRRSLAFLRTEFPSRVRNALTAGADIRTRFWTGFSREERLFTVYGLLSALWTVYAIFMGAMFWQQRMAGVMHSLRTQGDDLGKIAAAVGALVISLPLMLGIGFLYVSTIALLSAGLILISHTDLYILSTVERVLLLLGLAAFFSLLFLLQRQGASGLAWEQALLLESNTILPLLTLIFLVPTLFSFRHTQGVCQFCGRAVCREHAQSLPHTIEVCRNDQGVYKALVVADALFLRCLPTQR